MDLVILSPLILYTNQDEHLLYPILAKENLDSNEMTDL